MFPIGCEAGSISHVVILDVEDSGGSSQRLVELAAQILPENLSFSKLINPREPIQNFVSTHVHGIGDKDVRDEPPLVVVFNAFIDFLLSVQATSADTFIFCAQYLNLNRCKGGLRSFSLVCSDNKVKTMDNLGSIEIEHDFVLTRLT